MVRSHEVLDEVTHEPDKGVAMESQQLLSQVGWDSHGEVWRSWGERDSTMGRETTW